MVPASSLEGFVLTRGWRDAPEGLRLSYWLATPRGPLEVEIEGERAVMFVAREVEAEADGRRAVDLTTLWGQPVDALYFTQQRRMVDVARAIRERGHPTCESDVKPADRYLMERFITGPCRVTGAIRRRGRFLYANNPTLRPAEHRPQLTSLSLDIETDGFGGPIISIALVDDTGELCLAVEPPEAPRRPLESAALRLVPDEPSLLRAAFEAIVARDPDVLIGWNVVEFDLTELARRAEHHGVPFVVGRGRGRATILEPRSAGQLPIPRIPGRAVVDGIATMRTATYSFESFSLEHVAREVLGRGKIIDDDGEAKVAEIRRLWHEDLPALAAYNLEDCRLVRDIFAETKLLDFAVARQTMTGLPLSRVGGSVAAFDHLYLPRLHRKGRVAGEIARTPRGDATPGGYVLASEPGLFDNVLVLDFKSLYPSIIRTFCIDPLGMAFPGPDPVEGFEAARFNRREHILPGLIEELWKQRDLAKARQDVPSSRAIKILMNSFYGVLGTPGCRFYSPRLVSSITRRGHEIITKSRSFIEAAGRQVIYGDTDSLFVRLDPNADGEACQEEGAELARALNAWWAERLAEDHGVQSELEVELEVCYRRFFMPTLRGSSEGSAKRYAGWVEGDPPRLVVKGLEAARTDWTPLARRFQRELLRRVFLDEPFEEWIRGIRRDLFAGALDEELVYRKRLRRDADEYGASLPPHVRAARLLDRAPRVVRYVITTKGPEPVSKQQAPIDHHHYLERQLAPAADGILGCLGTSFSRIAGDQLQLF